MSGTTSTYPDGSIVSTPWIITLGGNVGSWSSSGLLSGAGSVEDSWLQLSGSDSGNFGIEYIARDDFYQDDGCYTLRFTVDMDSTFDVNNVGTLTFESPGYELHWNANEGASDGDNYQPTGQC